MFVSQKLKALLLLAFFFYSPLIAQKNEKNVKKEEKKWDVETSLGAGTPLEFVTPEGTWMNIDVSPDGKHLAFDLLGDIYLLPIEGGEATLIAGGPAYEVQPRFSPDSQWLSYTSDKDGADNIWIMKRDGTEARQITKEDFRLLNNACWSPDGNYLIARKHFTSERSLGAGEMWLYHISGGKGIQLTKRKNDQQDAGEPALSPDGRYVYFSEDMSPGGYFEYNKNPHGQIYIIRRLDQQTGKLQNWITGPGGAVRPQPSPNGKYVAFVRRVRTKSVLYLHDLETGEQRPLYDGLSKDQQETWATFGVYPNYNWTPDSQYLIFWAKGKIWKLFIKTLQVTEIPFQAKVKQTLQKSLRYPQKINVPTFESKMIRQATTSPDGKWLVFSAVGQLWKKQLPDGVPQRLTQQKQFEYWPNFSPDGNWIVYATWSDEEQGALYKIKLNGTALKKLTKKKGFYQTPSFSNDGKKIAYRRTTGDAILGFTHGTDPGLYWMSTNGGESHFIREGGTFPTLDQTGTRLYFVEDVGQGKKALKSVTLSNSEELIHFTSKYATHFCPSPDEQWLVFTELFNAYLIPFSKTGSALEISGKTDLLPIQKLTQDFGTSPSWSRNSQMLHWLVGSEFVSMDLKENIHWNSALASKEHPLETLKTTSIPIGLQLNTDVPTGKIALTGARILTMKQDEVIENGTILVEGNKIVAIGSAQTTKVPEGYLRFEVQGKTIMPGMIDVHAHISGGSQGISAQQNWMYLANLAFGVTTTHDPSNNTEMVFTHSEMIKSGKIIGPRVFSTGTILYGAEGDFKAVVNQYEDALAHLRRMKAVGAFSVKSYNQPRRNQRQQIIKAARELEMMVVPEGGSFFFHNMSMILDGHTGIEHSIPIAPIYNDVVTLWASSQVSLTPTLVVGYGGLFGENYWYQKHPVWKHKRLLKFTPRALVDERARRRTMSEDDDFGHIALAQNCKKLLDAGVKIQLGSHGQLQGLGAHWELWMFVQGGMTPMEALRSVTLSGAEYIGLDSELGSLEPGKLADLLVLEKNPLEDIFHSESIQWVMINGRLYEAETLNEIGHTPKKRSPFYWEKAGHNDAFIWSEDTQSFALNHCGCTTHH